MSFVLIVGAGLRTAVRTDRTFEKLLATGLTAILGIQAFIIIGGVLKVIPLTGITLPFVSYGRSNLLLTLAMTGILVNIGSERERVYGVSATDPLVAPAS